MKVESRPYFLGGEQVTVQVSEECKYSIIPQPSGMEVLSNLYEVAMIHKGKPDATEILGAYLTKDEVFALMGARLLAGIL